MEWNDANEDDQSMTSTHVDPNEPKKSDQSQSAIGGDKAASSLVAPVSSCSTHVQRPLRRKVLVRQRPVHEDDGEEIREMTDESDIGMTRAPHLPGHLKFDAHCQKNLRKDDGKIFAISVGNSIEDEERRLRELNIRFDEEDERRESRKSHEGHMDHVVPHSDPELYFDQHQNHFHRQVEIQLSKGKKYLNKRLKNAIQRGESILFDPEYEVDFGKTDYVSVFISIGSFVFDLGSDISVAYLLWKEENTYWWFLLTVTLMVVPSICINGFSLAWYWHEANPEIQNARIYNIKQRSVSRLLWMTRVIMHCLMLGPFLRYIDIIFYGTKSRQQKRSRHVYGPYCVIDKSGKKLHAIPATGKELQKRTKMAKEDRRRAAEESSVDGGVGKVDYCNLLKWEQRDSAMLDMLHSLLSDAPQLVLQLYILIRRPPISKDRTDLLETVLAQSFSVAMSLFSLSWSVTSYNAALRFAIPEKKNLNLFGKLLQFFWRGFTVGSRVVAMALFASVHRGYLIVGIAGHWAMMSLWIFIQGTDFCSTANASHEVQESLFNATMGWVYVFCFVNLKPEPSRRKFLLFYIITFTEEVAMLAAWWFDAETREDKPWYYIPAIPAVIGSFWVGIAFMLVYYWRYHPSGTMPIKRANTAPF